MSVRPLLCMGDARLLQKAEPVSDFTSPDLAQLIEDMRDTMQENNGAGLAAPQIGVSLRVVIFGSGSNPRYPDAEEVPQTLLINPHIEILDRALELAWEGCLSVPGLRGEVPRFSAIRYSGYGVDGEPLQREVNGFHARVVQHEVDHLDGVLYPVRMPDMSRFGFEEILNL